MGMWRITYYRGRVMFEPFWAMRDVLVIWWRWLRWGAGHRRLRAAMYWRDREVVTDWRSGGAIDSWWWKPSLTSNSKAMMGWALCWPTQALAWIHHHYPLPLMDPNGYLNSPQNLPNQKSCLLEFSRAIVCEGENSHLSHYQEMSGLAQIHEESVDTNNVLMPKPSTATSKHVPHHEVLTPILQISNTANWAAGSVLVEWGLKVNWRLCQAWCDLWDEEISW